MTSKRTWGVMCAVLLALLGQAAWAADCVLHVTRVACPGQEKVSFAKCNGTASCDVTTQTDSAAACAAAALTACENVAARQPVTMSKTITALFGGTAVEGGKNFCDATRPDFNKCK